MKLTSFSFLAAAGNRLLCRSPSESSRPPISDDPGSAVLALLGFSLSQLVLSILMLAAVILLAIHWQAQAWLGLFGLLTFPLCLTGWILLLSMRLLKKGRNWPLVWCGLLSLSCLTSWAALQGYDWWVNTNELDGLNSVQAFVSSQIFTCLLIGIPLWRTQTQSREVQIANLKQLALAAELKALQAQVEPHFLYNTLANSRYLARHDPDKAVQMLDHLIAYLQSALPDLRQPMSTVGREFELAEHYLALMSIRFGERMRFQLDYVPALHDTALPPMMLMSLVENAVQHGVERQPGEVNILLQAHQKNGYLHVIVSDNGAGLEQNVIGHGLGLRNLRERLHALYAGKARFELRMTPEQRTVAELIVPLVSSTI